MPKTQRFYNIAGNFAAGVLSPSSQDNVDSEVYAAGLTDATNFVIRRDGSISSRRAFVRGQGDEFVFDNPRWGVLSTVSPYWFSQGDTTIFKFDGSDGSAPEVEPDIYTKHGGIFPFNRIININVPNDSEDFLRVQLLSNYCRSITFHDVQLREGSWQTGGKLTFRAWAYSKKAAGGFASFPLIPDGDGDPLIANSSNDPFQPGAFAPGIVRRDITLSLSPERNNAATRARLDIPPLNITGVGLRVAEPTAARPISLAIGGWSAWSGGDALPARIRGQNPYPAVRRDPDTGDFISRVYGDAFRLIPWVIQDEPFVLLMGMESVRMYYVGENSLPHNTQEIFTYQFTPKQLRELTWTAFGNSLLLLHRDFPMPLRVIPPLTNTGSISIEPLILRNIPHIPASARTDAAVDVQVEGDTVRIATTGSGSVGQAFNLNLSPGPLSLRAHWPTIQNAIEYDIFWSTESDFDVVNVEDEDQWRAWILKPATSSAEGLLVREHTITGLNNSLFYRVAVRGNLINPRPDGGEEKVFGPLLSASASPYAKALPDIASVTTATSTTDDGHVDVSWTAIPAASVAPGHADYYQVTDYIVQWAFDPDENEEPEWLDANLLTPVTGSSHIHTTGVPGVRYVYRVQARGPDEAFSPWKQTDDPILARWIAPAAPRNFTADPGTINDGDIYLGWTKGDSRDTNFPTDGYIIEQTIGSGAPETRDLGRRTILTLSGMVGTVYDFRLRAYRGVGDARAFSAWVSASVTGSYTTPDVPFLQATRGTTSGRVNLTWTRIPGATSYEWQFRTESGDYGSSRSTERTSVTHDGTVGTTYVYRVRAIKGTGSDRVESDWSNEASTLSGGTVKPGTPSGLTATQSSRGPILVSWSPVTGATAYEYRWKYGSRAYITTATGNVTSHTIVLVEDATTYSFQVRARNLGGTSGWSSTFTLTTRAAELDPPDTPTGLRVVTNSPGRYNASWNAVTGATAYTLALWSRKTGWVYHKTTSNSRVGTGVEGRAYAFQVRAENADGRSGWTSSFTVVIQKRTVTPPTERKPSEPAWMHVTKQVHSGFSWLVVSWPTALRATSYTIQYARPGSVPYQLNSYTISGLSHSLAVTPSSYWGIRVRANNSFGSSDWNAWSYVTSDPL